jgi:SAM-dependent methyltransferase
MLRRTARRPDEPSADTAHVAAQTETHVASRAFPKFLATLAGREHVTIIDVGPIVGPNLDFFATRAACKFYVEDFFAEIERQGRAGTREKLAAILPPRIRQEDASVDAILCWDLFDFLDKATSAALAREMVRVLKPGGSLFGLFANQVGEQKTHYTKFGIVDDTHFRHRTVPAAPVTCQVLPNRDIIRLFEGLIVSDSFLLLTHTREIVFRKK